jgi:hypothetical protein
MVRSPRCRSPTRGCTFGRGSVVALPAAHPLHGRLLAVLRRLRFRRLRLERQVGRRRTDRGTSIATTANASSTAPPAAPSRARSPRRGGRPSSCPTGMAAKDPSPSMELIRDRRSAGMRWPSFVRQAAEKKPSPTPASNASDTSTAARGVYSSASAGTTAPEPARTTPREPPRASPPPPAEDPNGSRHAWRQAPQRPSRAPPRRGWCQTP